MRCSQIQCSELASGAFFPLRAWAPFSFHFPFKNSRAADCGQIPLSNWGCFLFKFARNFFVEGSTCPFIFALYYLPLPNLHCLPAFLFCRSCESVGGLILLMQADLSRLFFCARSFICSLSLAQPSFGVFLELSPWLSHFLSTAPCQFMAGRRVRLMGKILSEAFGRLEAAKKIRRTDAIF